MFSKLRGTVDEIGEDSITLDVGGVGYHVYCSGRTLQSLGAGQALSLIIETQVREESITLFGFPNSEEREWFRLLTTVQGVGAKMGMALMSAYPPAVLANAIAAKDTAALTRVSGVGPKLAERLVTELKNKVAKLATAPLVIGANAKGNKKQKPENASVGVNEDAVSALVNLGYNRMEAFTAVAMAAKKVDDAEKLDELIRAGLKELAR